MSFPERLALIQGVMPALNPHYRDAIRETFIGLTKANQVERRPFPLSELTIGMECGGSDGW